MGFKIALHMCGWGPRPLPDLLVAARKLDYDAVELAPSWLEKTYGSEQVDEMLRTHGIPLAPAIFVQTGNCTDPAALPGAVETARKYCRWVRERDGWGLILGPVAGRNGNRTKEERKAIHRAYHAIGAAVREEGCVPLYHHHYLVSHEVSRQVLCEDLEGIDWSTWRLCVDTGHLVLALHDPVAVVADWAPCIGWVHCKDVKAAQFPIPEHPTRFVDLHPLFTELGNGVIDFPQVLEILRRRTDLEWLVVEQDATDKTPYEAAKISREYLRKIL